MPNPTIVPPVFAPASDDPALLVFDSVGDAEGYAEPWDVNDGLWRFWDCTGRVLTQIDRIGDRREWTSLVPTDRVEPEELRDLVILELTRLGSAEAALAKMELRALCEVAEARINERQPAQLTRWLKSVFKRVI